MKRLIQPNDWSCLAACACMITDEPLEALYADLGHDGSEIIEDSQFADGRRGFAFCEITRYLAGRGFNLGAPMGHEVDSFRSRPALLIVNGANYNHAVVWSGWGVFDPAPHQGNMMKLAYYDIKQWWPIVQISKGVENGGK